jgi:hypothetical protein
MTFDRQVMMMVWVPGGLVREDEVDCFSSKFIYAGKISNCVAS